MFLNFCFFQLLIFCTHSKSFSFLISLYSLTFPFYKNLVFLPFFPLPFSLSPPPHHPLPPPFTSPFHDLLYSFLLLSHHLWFWAWVLSFFQRKVFFIIRQSRGTVSFWENISGTKKGGAEKRERTICTLFCEIIFKKNRQVYKRNEY
ncbi:hypothetical protein HOY82DRAFT_354057 [Tuber indicum]|nr:hypothetical protein HOY82DRAFT_354057 [Tuber indicum]